MTIDTSSLSPHQLRDIVKNRLTNHDTAGMAVQFQSFGFKNGVSVDTDIVFDIRCLPNPYWIIQLRSLNGLDQDVIEFLESQNEVQDMYSDIKNFLARWLPKFEANSRSYITIAIGCTGGQHRSVYFCEKLKNYFTEKN